MHECIVVRVELSNFGFTKPVKIINYHCLYKLIIDIDKT